MIDNQILPAQFHHCFSSESFLLPTSPPPPPSPHQARRRRRLRVPAPFALPSSIPPRPSALAILLVAGGGRPGRSGGRSGRVPVEFLRLVSFKTAVESASSNPSNRVGIQIFTLHRPSPKFKSLLPDSTLLVQARPFLDSISKSLCLHRFRTTRLTAANNFFCFLRIPKIVDFFI
jgi:hypothetical protein